MKIILSIALVLCFLLGHGNSICIKHILYNWPIENQTEAQEIEQNVKCTAINISVKLQAILDDLDLATPDDLNEIESETVLALENLGYYVELLKKRNTTTSIAAIPKLNAAFVQILDLAKELLTKAEATQTTTSQTLLSDIISSVQIIVSKLTELVNQLV